MIKFINDKIALFVIMALAVGIVALVFACKNKKALKQCENVNHITDEERAKLGRIDIDDQGNISATC